VTIPVNRIGETEKKNQSKSSASQSDKGGREHRLMDRGGVTGGQTQRSHCHKIGQRSQKRPREHLNINLRKMETARTSQGTPEGDRIRRKEEIQNNPGTEETWG